MKKITKLSIFGIFLLFGFVFSAKAEENSNLISWEKTIGISSGSNLITSETAFNAVYFQVLEGNPEDFCIKPEGFISCMDLELEPKGESENIFLMNPSSELFIKARNKGVLQMHFVNSINGPSFAKSDLTASAGFADFTAAGIDIVKRTTWGADESLGLVDPKNPPPPAIIKTVDNEYYETYKDELKIVRTIETNARGDEYVWPRKYPEKIRKLIVHHTASTSSLDNPEAAMRAIYHYHTVSRGWGDIGYNFVIAPDGTIYEGRAGGDMVVGGHAAPANIGSVGIAVLGDYHTEMEVPVAVQESLVKILAFLSEKYSLNPTGISSFRGVDLPNIIGHRDVGHTACPGDRLYKLLPTVRTTVNKIAANWADASEYDFALAQQLPFFNIDPTTEKTLAINLKNIGSKTWGPGTQLIPVATSNAVRATIAASELLDPQVKPNEEGTFITTVRSKNRSGAEMVQLALKINEDETTEATFPIPIKVAPLKFDYEFIEAKHPKGSLVAEEVTNASVTIKNTSNFKWAKEGEYEVHIAGIDPQGRVSSFFTPPEQTEASDQIIIDTTKLATLREAEVLPGETAHFDFTFTAPEEYGSFTEKFNLYAPSSGWFPDKGMQFKMYVRAPLARASVVENPENSVFYLNGGERDTFKIKLKNTGEMIWKEGRVRFESDDPFFPSTATYFDGPVKPGETAEMTVEIQGPYKNGVSTAVLTLTNDVQNGDFIAPPRVRVINRATLHPILQGKVLGEQNKVVTMRPWEVKEVEIKVKNTGSVAWSKAGGPDGQGVMMLGTSYPRNRKSSFETNLWIKPTRGAIMKEDLVLPGETATFILTLRASGRTGAYQEFFMPVVDWVEWVPTAPVKIWVQVLQDSSAPAPHVDYRPIPKEDIKTEPETIEEDEEEEIAKEEKGAESDIRVLLSFRSNRFEISSEQEFYAKDLDDNKIATFRPGEIAVFDGGEFNGKSYVGLRFETRYGGPLEVVNWEHTPSWSDTINDNLYRDTLEVRYYAGSWILINELGLEDYLKGIAEVPEDDPLEKHKAVLVAARTYALWYITSERKFPGAPYDASDDPAVFQKYLGYNYEQRAPRHLESVNSTEGVVVTYDGEVVKTPYFNSSDGRTRSAEEAWGWTHTPYLQSVQDPYCTVGVRRGHGVGLSGCGASGAAARGKTYEEILEYYYQDIVLKDLY